MREANRPAASGLSCVTSVRISCSRALAKGNQTISSGTEPHHGAPCRKRISAAATQFPVYASDSSTAQAMTFHEIFQEESLLFAAMNAFERAFG
jgi:hypothetical protein